MSKISLTEHGTSLSTAVRKDVTSFFRDCVTETMDLYEKSKEVLLEKGLYVRSPYIPIPKKVDFVKEQSFIRGFLGEKRPLTCQEITSMYSNLQKNSLGVCTLIGFSQISSEPEVTTFLKRGRDIAKRHCRVFEEHLSRNFLHVPITLGSEVTDNTKPIFSDKLMMFFTTVLIGLGVQYYGQSFATSPRRDLGFMYNKLSLEIEMYSEDGANIMIRHGWLEEPPKALDRDRLTQTNIS